MNLYIIARKNSSCWEFDHEHLNTVSELLCNGTEKVIDWYYKMLHKKYPLVGDQLGFYLSTIKFDDAITKVNLLESHESGSTYSDDLSGMNVWLCPWLQSYFKTVPERLYVSCEILETISEEELDSIVKYYDE